MQRINQKELASRLGLSTRQIRNLEDQGVLQPDSEDGRKGYPWPSSNRAYIEFKVGEALRKAEVTATEEAERRKAIADARLAEIRVGKEEGTLITLEAHETVTGEAADRIMAVLQNAPGNYTAQLERAGVAPAVAQQLLEQLAEDLIRALRGTADELEAADDGDADLPD